MGRPENPLNPADGPLAQFAWDLRQLRTRAGKPTYRKLATKAGYSDTALSGAASGKDLPSLELTLAFVGACGGDMPEWEERWRLLAAEPSPAAPATGGGKSAPGPPSLPARPVQPTGAETPKNEDQINQPNGSGVTPLATVTPVAGAEPAVATATAQAQPAVEPIEARPAGRRRVWGYRHRPSGRRRQERSDTPGRRIREHRGATLAFVAGTLALAVVLSLFVVQRLGARPHHQVPPVAGGSPRPSSARPPSPAPSARTRHARVRGQTPPPTVALVTPAPSQPAAQPATTAPQPGRLTGQAALTSFNAVAGVGCTSGGSYGSYADHGWIDHSAGGLAGAGCSGQWLSHWVTGSSSSIDCCDTSYSTYTWWFKTGLTKASCDVRVYIPSGTSTEVGGYAVRYTVYTGSGQSAVAFKLDQRDNMGAWLDGGTFPDNGTLEIQVDNSAGGHHQVAASAVQATCNA